jgi:hypothetical protein
VIRAWVNAYEAREPFHSPHMAWLVSSDEYDCRSPSARSISGKSVHRSHPKDCSEKVIRARSTEVRSAGDVFRWQPEVLGVAGFSAAELEVVALDVSQRVRVAIQQCVPAVRPRIRRSRWFCPTALAKCRFVRPAG